MKKVWNVDQKTIIGLETHTHITHMYIHKIFLEKHDKPIKV